MTWAHAGRAAWLDKDKMRCVVLWKTHPEWASTIAAWARDCGHTDSVVTLEELSSGDDVDGTGDALYAPARVSRCIAAGIHVRCQLFRCRAQILKGRRATFLCRL